MQAALDAEALLALRLAGHRAPQLGVQQHGVGGVEGGRPAAAGPPGKVSRTWGWTTARTRADRSRSPARRWVTCGTRSPSAATVELVRRGFTSCLVAAKRLKIAHPDPACLRPVLSAWRSLMRLRSCRVSTPGSPMMKRRISARRRRCAYHQRPEDVAAVQRLHLRSGVAGRPGIEPRVRVNGLLNRAVTECDAAAGERRDDANMRLEPAVEPDATGADL